MKITIYVFIIPLKVEEVRIKPQRLVPLGLCQEVAKKMPPQNSDVDLNRQEHLKSMRSIAYHQNEVLYTIKPTDFLCTPKGVMIYTLMRGDIPSLSA
ncbi:MAG: hypothetical protein PUB05_02775 [Firmicutes bacterium]|nr:hypothetical protein [Bacillota bacterium]